MTLDALYQELLQKTEQGELEINRTLADGIYMEIIAAFAVEAIKVSDCRISKTASEAVIEGRIETLKGICRIEEEYRAQIVMRMMQREPEEISYHAVISLKCDIPLEELTGKTAPFVAVDGTAEESLFTGIRIIDPDLEYIAPSREILIRGFASMKELPDKWSPYRFLLDSKMPVEGKLLPHSFFYPHLTMTFLGQKAIRLPIGEGSGSLVIDTVDDFERYEYYAVTQAYMRWEITVTELKKQISFWTGLFSEREEWQFSAFFASPFSIGDVRGILKNVMQLPDGMMLMPQGAFLSSFGLQQLDIVYGTAGETMQADWDMKHVRGIFALDRPLEILIPNLTLSSFQAAWESSRWGGGDFAVTLFLAASACVSIGNLRIEGDVTTYFPYLQFEGSLSLTNQESFQDVAQECGVDLPDFWKADENRKNEIAQIDVVGDVIYRTIELNLLVENVLKLKISNDLSFELEEVQADIAYGSGSMEFGVSGILAFQYQENDEEERFAFALSAAYAEEDWLFSGSLAYGQVDMVRLVTCLLGMQVEDAQALHVVLQDFSISYSTKKKELLVYASCEIWFEIFGVKPTLGGKVLFRQKEYVKEAALAAYLEIGIFTILAQVDDIYKADKKYLFRIELWNKYLQAVYQKDTAGNEILSFSLGGMTVGDIVLALIHLINPNGKSSLSSPWNVLDRISLSDFIFTLNVTQKTAYFLYHLNRNIAGVMEVEDIGIAYDGKSIRYILTGRCLNQKYTLENPFSWDAQNGSPEENIAANEQKFHLYYFAVGNHLDIDITGSKLDDILQNIRKKMEPQNDVPEFSYRENAGWLVASEFELSDIFRVSLLFYDPEIYGAVIEVNVSEKSPLAVLNGLFLELYYKKISDETGMFHCRLTLPKKFSVLDFGTVKLYLGEMLLEIYTNGSFYLDLGFPHNRDFSASWGISVGIFGGKGGVYLGVFHGDAVNSVPEVTNGAFSPVVKIGVGLSVGLMQSFDVGIAKGGVSLTAVGMFEGVFALFHPIRETEPEAYYYKVSAVVGVVGTLFLSVDFKIITISANAQISAFCLLEMESYRKSRLTMDLELKVSASIKILFIKISFSFHFSHSASFTFGSDQNTPWQLRGAVRNELRDEPLPKVILDAAALSEKIGISPVIVPVCSLTDQNGQQESAYSMAFLAFLSPEDFAAVLTLLCRMLCAEQSGMITERFSAALQAQEIGGAVDYAFVLELFSGHIDVNIGISSGKERAEDANDINGTVFPMLPQLTLAINDRSIDFGNRMADEQYMQELSAYFEKLNADTEYLLPDSADTDEEIPICGAVLTDWVKMLIEELKGRISGIFRSFSKSCTDISVIKDTYGVEDAVLLRENPQMLLSVSSLPELAVSVCEGDTLQKLAETYSLDAEGLWNCVAQTAGLLSERFRINLEEYLFDNSKVKLTRKEAAAAFYVRLFQSEVLYSPYAEYILEKNSGLDMEWKCERTGAVQVELPDEKNWRALAGDTIVLVAKAYAVSCDLCEEDSWNRFYGEFMERNKTEQADAYQLFGSYACTGYATAVDLFRHCFPDFEDDPEQYPLWNAPILRPAAVVKLTDIPLDQEETAEALERKYGTDAVLQALQDGTANLSGGQEIVISGARSVPEQELEEMILTEAAVSEISAVISRAFLQGSRLCDPELQIQKPIYEVLKQQITLPDVLEDISLQLSCHSGDTWIHIRENEIRLTVDQIKSWLPEEQKETAGIIREMPPFSVQTQCWTMAEGWKLLTAGTASYIGVLPASVSGYLETYPEALYMEKDGKPVNEVQWAAMLTLRLCRKSKGVYCMQGVKADEQDLAFSLLAEKDYTCRLYYLPSRLESEQEVLIPVDSAGCALVKANLSKETHYTVNRLGAEEQGYIATIENPAFFMRFLWECSVIGGGYWFSCPSDNISETVFDEGGYGEIMLAVSFRDFPERGDVVNAVYIPVAPEGTALYGDREQIKVPELPAGCTGFTVEREFDQDDRFQSLFQLLGYEAADSAEENKGYESAPILPVETGDGDRMMYRFVFPMWKMYGDNPYAGIGKTSNLSLFLRDVLGNRRTYMDHTVTGVYNDLMIGIHELPDTKLTYGFVTENDSRYIKIICEASFDEAEIKTDGNNPGSMGEADKARLQMAYWQYSREDVRLSVIFSMCGAGIGLPAEVRGRLAAYIHALYMRLCGDTSAVPGVEILCEIPKEAAVGTICPIILRLKAERGDSERDDAAAVSAETKVMPVEAEGEECFEAGFEAAFTDYQVAYDNQNQRYAVSRSLFSNLEIRPYHLRVGDKQVAAPEFYALSPWSRSLLTKEVAVSNDLGEQEIYTFTDIDANQWEKQFLSDIETFLSDKVICTAADVCPEEVNKLIGIKEELAGQLTGRLCPVRAGADDSVPAEVIRIAGERFLCDLNLAYETGVIASYQAVWKNNTQYRLEPVVEENACLSASKLTTLSQEDESGTFCLFFREADVTPAGLKVSFPYLEYNISSGIEGYEKSDWLRLYTPVTEGITLESDLNFPFPKNACPKPPQLLEQSNGTEQEKIMRYRWSCTLSAKVYEQDTLYLQLQYDHAFQKAAPEEDRLDVLARYQLERDAILAMLNTEDAIIDAYRKFVPYAEQYACGEEKLRSDMPAAGEQSGTINIELGFCVMKEKAAIRILNEDAVGTKMRELGAVLKLPEQVDRNPEDGTIQFEAAITGLSVCECNWMKPKVHLIRNENLFCDPEVAVNEKFIFYTETVELDRLHMTADYKEPFEINEGSLEASIQKAWEILEMNLYPARLNMTIFYEYPVAGRENKLFAAIPVTFMTDIPEPESIRKNIEDWRAAYMPNLNGGKIIMDVCLYERDSDAVLVHALLSLVNVWQ